MTTSLIEMWPFRRRFEAISSSGDITLYTAKDRLVIDIPIREDDMKKFGKLAESGIESMEVVFIWKEPD